jgi:hypothetical protein
VAAEGSDLRVRVRVLGPGAFSMAGGRLPDRWWWWSVGGTAAAPPTEVVEEAGLGRVNGEGRGISGGEVSGGGSGGGEFLGGGSGGGGAPEVGRDVSGGGGQARRG